MSVYIVAEIAIHDRETYGIYEAGFLDIFVQYQGEILSVDDAPSVIEGEWRYTRLVLGRFPDREEFDRWYRSPAYQALAQHRFRAATANILLAAGMP